MKCVIYLRVSTKEQAQTDEKEGYSIAAQREACVKYIQDKGWEMVDEFTDRGESARSAHRPQLQQMLSRIKKGKDIDAVVVHKIDRLARNMEDHIAIKAILKKSGAFLVSVVENIEDSASGRLVEGIHALMAEFYSANLAGEIKKGMSQKVKAGGWPHKAPVGYKNVREGSRGIAKIVVDPETSPIIQEAFKLYATGNWSVEDVRDFLFDKGIGHRKGGKGSMGLNGVHKLLMNPFYTGVVVYKGVQYDGQHEAIISQSLFQKVQVMLDMRNQSGERKRKHPHYLKGSLYCADCGGRISYILAKGKYPYFYCLRQYKSKNEDCQAKYTDVAKVEKAVEDLYKHIQLTQEAADKLVQKFNEQILNDQSGNALEEQFLGKRITKLANEKLKLMRAYYEGAVPMDVLKTEQERIAKETVEAKERLDSITVKLDQKKEVLDKGINLALSCGLGYEKAKESKRRLYNQAFFEKIHIKDGKIQKVEYTDLFNVLLSKSSNKKHMVEDRGFEPLTFWLPAQRSPS